MDNPESNVDVEASKDREDDKSENSQENQHKVTAMQNQDQDHTAESKVSSRPGSRPVSRAGSRRNSGKHIRHQNDDVDGPPASMHEIRMEEFAPATQVIRDEEMTVEFDELDDPQMAAAYRAWRSMGCRSFSKRMREKANHQNSTEPIPASVRSYYRKMDDVITSYAAADQNLNSLDDQEQNKKENLRKAEILAKLSLATNVALLILKAAAAGLSGSLSVISSLVDSIIDLVSGSLMWFASNAMRKRLPYKYPSGRTRLEPVAIIILSAIMAVAAVQLIAESIQTIVKLVNKTYPGIVFDNITIGVLAAVMLSKAILWIVCRTSSSPSVLALAQDHRNDVLSNAVAALCGFFGHRYWPYLDPIGAILIASYILFNWWRTGSEQIKLLTGFTADPAFLNYITWISLHHDSRVLQIDTVRAYHFGNDFLVEVHIVLPEEMGLKESHDIGEALQNKLEQLERVERAFVHIDYESLHDPETEHKVM